MIFTSPQFVLFFLLFYSLYSGLEGRSRKILLLVASYLFYGSWNAKFLLLIIGSTLLDYSVGRALAKTDEAKQRKRLLLLSIVGNLGVLAFFKYFNFFVGSAVDALGALGVGVPPVVLNVLLPVGISFYTFQTMSYSIDVFRRKIKPAQSLLDFSLYVAFFPQLVAGPIERPAHLLPQLSQNILRPLRSGWTLIAIGVFKKAIVADSMAVLANLAYADPSQTYPIALWIGTYAFAIQIYCDFSGYSDIAVGLSRLMGIDLVQNFRAPYAAINPSDFWQRWHISLSSWLRDYLYIPLGGNRGSWLFVQRNLLITMLLGGLWHGARWNFVLWGAYHGALLAIFRLPWVMRVEAWMDSAKGWRIPLLVLRRFAFFQLVCLSWALFRAQTLEQCGVLLAKMLNPAGWQLTTWFAEMKLSGEGNYLMLMMGLSAAIVLIQNFHPKGTHDIAVWVDRWPRAIAWLFVATVLTAAVALAPEKPPPFIYFQF